MGEIRKLNDAFDLSEMSEGGFRIWELRIRESILVPFCVALCLLRDRLIQGIDAQEQGRTAVVRFVIGQGQGAYPAAATWRDGGVTLALSPTELDFVTTFFLKTVRDGMAPVGHIDIEASGDPTGHFILQFPLAELPMSGEDANKILRSSGGTR